MKRTRTTIVLAALAAALAPAAATAADNPGKTCAATGNMELGSRGACASTVATGTGQPSNAAFVANCKELEKGFAAESETGRPYPYSFYGNPDYTARNRRDCVVLLRGFHSGQLPPGPGGD